MHILLQKYYYSFQDLLQPGINLGQVHIQCFGTKHDKDIQWRTEGWGWGVQLPPRNSEGPTKNRAKLNPIVKTVKNCWIQDANTPRCLEKKRDNFTRTGYSNELTW